MIPCVVVVYRVLMVCHVELCCNHGEKAIRDRLCGYSVQSARARVGNTRCVSRLCVSAPLAVSLVTLLYRDHVRDFLICSSSEERLRFNLRDFWLEANYQDENFGNLPPYHPFCVLLIAICKRIVIQEMLCY